MSEHAIRWCRACVMFTTHEEGRCVHQGSHLACVNLACRHHGLGIISARQRPTDLPPLDADGGTILPFQRCA